MLVRRFVDFCWKCISDEKCQPGEPILRDFDEKMPLRSIFHPSSPVFQCGDQRPDASLCAPRRKTPGSSCMDGDPGTSIKRLCQRNRGIRGAVFYTSDGATGIWLTEAYEKTMTCFRVSKGRTRRRTSHGYSEAQDSHTRNYNSSDRITEHRLKSVLLLPRVYGHAGAVRAFAGCAAIGDRALRSGPRLARR